MPAIVIVGAQWGDEGKGKATDLLGHSVDFVVRYQGGNNAGHTVFIGDESYALQVTERYLGKARIGTTGRGIGPTYADKAARVGIRVQVLFDEAILHQKLELVLREKNQVLTKVYNRRGIEAGAVCDEYVGYGKRLARYSPVTAR